MRPTTASGVRLLRGVLYNHSRRCGRPNCHCAEGEPHQTPALAYSEGGRTRTLTLAADQVPLVRRALARYEKARARLDAEATAGVRALRAQRQSGRKSR